MSAPRKSASSAGAQRIAARTTEADRPKSPLPLNSQARRMARAGLALAVVVLALWIARDFLASLAWAAILAIALWPLYTRMVKTTAHGGPPLLAPLLFALLTGFVLFAPLLLVTQEVTHESERVMSWLTSLRESGVAVPAWVAPLPVVGEHLERWWNAKLADPGAVGSWFQGV